MLLASTAFTVGGVVLLMQHATVKGTIGGALAAPFFGACAVLLVRRLIRNRPDLILDAHGLEHVQLGRIAWTEIAAVRIREMRIKSGVQRFIEVVLHDPAAYLVRAPRVVRATAAANRSLGFGPASIPATTVTARLEDVVAAMHRYHPRLGEHG
ncbi:hypothetical protein F7Q99_11795 [Streptomyces kaniharaensis]|uniref:PH domain-containing protein n=2 Tax=Streptomyces kaniharaensis TaxID=212423 RepID=A0A6N7KN78_9ACTN|nr:hypothetical protein [Streptomyces kaniharaensis]